MYDSKALDSELRRVGPQGVFPKASLMPPADHGYLLLAAEIDHGPGPFFWFESAAKRDFLAKARTALAALSPQPGVVEATLFRAVIAPPGRGAYLRARPSVHHARFDLVMLIELADAGAAQTMRENVAFRALENDLRADGRHVEVVVASNARRIAPVDHSRGGIFLFNFFYADALSQNLAVWEYTAGWFEDQTGLDNSTLLLPSSASKTDYTIINHCRWNGLADVLPALLFKRSFHDYVLANFEANRTAAMPILYRLA